MIFPILKEYKVTMKHKRTDGKIEFMNHNPYDIRVAADMARERYPNLRLVRITLERLIIMEDFP